MARLIITDEQKLEAAQIAINGGSPFAFLKGLGAKNPGGAWYNVKQWLEKTHPDVLEKIPTHSKAWRAPKELKLDAGENYEISAKEAMDNIKEAADDFFDGCKKAGLSIELAPEEVKPLSLDGLEIAGIRHQDLGEFYYDKKFNSIDWRTPEGDEVGMSPVWWRQLLSDLPKILKMLGVEA